MRDDRGERKKYKIINRSVIVTVHICTVTVGIVYKCTILYPLMWVFFGQKCIKRLPFFYFAKVYTSDVIVLSKKLFKIDGWSIVF